MTKPLFKSFASSEAVIVVMDPQRARAVAEAMEASDHAGVDADDVRELQRSADYADKLAAQQAAKAARRRPLCVVDER